MSNKEYPVEILVDEDLVLKRWTAFGVNAKARKAYDLGKEHARVDAGDWHNLTAAINAGEPIDFEKLDGRKVRMGRGESSVETVINRDSIYPVDAPAGWHAQDVWTVFRDGWNDWGWTLYLDGEIPMRKQTADELPFGNKFEGADRDTYVKVGNSMAQRLTGNGGFILASEIEVIKVLGMYGQKESE